MSESQFRFWPWFQENWSRAALPAGITGLLLLLTTQFAGNQRAAMVAALLPIYMIHQYEEHERGSFVAFINKYVGKGLPVLTVVSAFWINILLVWVLFLAIGAVTRWISPILVLAPVYATLINAVVHIAATARLRIYNPGLITAIVLFVPWGIVCLVAWTRHLDRPWLATAIGLTIGVLVHAAIVAWVVYRKRQLESRGH